MNMNPIRSTRPALRRDTIITNPEERTTMAGSGERRGFERVIHRWQELDDGWKATALALGISLVVSAGGGIPW